MNASKEGEVIYRCKFCSNFFQTPEELVDHKKEKHIEDIKNEKRKKKLALILQKQNEIEVIDIVGSEPEPVRSNEVTIQAQDSSASIPNNTTINPVLPNEAVQLPESTSSSSSIRNKGAKNVTTTARNLPVKCKYCKKEFTRNSALSRHELTHYKKKCKNCTESFHKERELVEHLRIVHKEGVKASRKKPKQSSSANKCPFCSFSTTSSGRLIKHVQLHHSTPESEPGNEFRCQYCSKATGTRTGLDLHIRYLCKNTVRHPEDEETRKRKQIAESYNMLQHIGRNKSNQHQNFIHSVRKVSSPSGNSEYLIEQFICSSCDLQFHSSLEYQEHCRLEGHKATPSVQSETRNTMFICPVCKGNFSDLSSLRVHSQTIHKPV